MGSQHALLDGCCQTWLIFLQVQTQTQVCLTAFMRLNSKKTSSRNYAFTVLNSTDYYLSKKPLYLQLDSFESHETAAICSERGSGCRTATLRWALHSTGRQTQQQPDMKRRHSVLSRCFAKQKVKWEWHAGP